MCVFIQPTMAPIEGEIEVVDNTIEEVLTESARPTVSGVESVCREQEQRSEEKSGVEYRTERMEGMLGMLEKEVLTLRVGISERKVEVETVKWGLGEALARIERLSD